MLVDILTKRLFYNIYNSIMMANIVNLMGFRVTRETNVGISLWDLLDEVIEAGLPTINVGGINLWSGVCD